MTESNLNIEIAKCALLSLRTRDYFEMTVVTICMIPYANWGRESVTKRRQVDASLSLSLCTCLSSSDVSRAECKVPPEAASGQEWRIYDWVLCVLYVHFIYVYTLDTFCHPPSGKCPLSGTTWRLKLVHRQLKLTRSNSFYFYYFSTVWNLNSQKIIENNVFVGLFQGEWKLTFSHIS